MTGTMSGAAPVSTRLIEPRAARLTFGSPPTLQNAGKNQLYYGDNLDVLPQYIKDEPVDVVYLDPPFNSNRNYSVIVNRDGQTDNQDAAQIEAFEDTWHWTP